MKQKVWYIDDPYWEEKPETGEEHKPCAVEPKAQAPVQGAATPLFTAIPFSCAADG
jgi:hypothetical protein